MAQSTIKGEGVKQIDISKITITNTSKCNVTVASSGGFISGNVATFGLNITFTNSGTQIGTNDLYYLDCSCKILYDGKPISDAVCSIFGSSVASGGYLQVSSGNFLVRAWCTTSTCSNSVYMKIIAIL